MSLFAAAGWAATVLTVVTFTLQARSVRAAADVSGVAPAMWVLVTAQVGGWTAYGIVAGLAQSVVTNVAVGFAAAVVWSRLVRDPSCPRGRQAFVTGAASAVTLAAAAFTVPATALAVLGVCGLAGTLPQAYRALRPGELDGVSLAGWVAGLAGSVCWGLYGVGVGVHVMWVNSLVGTIGSLVVITRLMSDRRKRQAPAGHTAPAPRACAR